MFPEEPFCKNHVPEFLNVTRTQIYNYSHCMLTDEELDRKIKSKLLEEERRYDSDSADEDLCKTDADRKLARTKRRRRRRTDEDLSEGSDSETLIKVM